VKSSCRLRETRECCDAPCAHLNLHVTSLVFLMNRPTPAALWVFSGYIVLCFNDDRLISELQRSCGFQHQPPSVALDSVLVSSGESQTLRLQVHSPEPSTLLPILLKFLSSETLAGVTWALSQAGVTVDPGIDSLHSSTRSHGSMHSTADVLDTDVPHSDSSRSTSRRGSGIRRRLPSGITTTPGHPSSVFFVVNRSTDGSLQRCALETITILRNPRAQEFVFGCPGRACCGPAASHTYCLICCD
jgi:hypothetical protein